MQNWASKRSKTGAGEGLGTTLRVRALSEELGNNQNCEEVAGRESDDEDDTADQEEPPKLKSYKEAVVALEEVSRFLEFKGHGDEVLSIGCTIDRIVNLKHASARQTTLHDYFTH